MGWTVCDDWPVQETAEALLRLNVRLFHNRCFYCGCYLHYDKRDEFRRTIDHIHPRAKTNRKWGGKVIPLKRGGKIRNTVCCCHGCNKRKSTLSVDEWRVVLFGGHGGKFWAEQFMDSHRCVEFIPFDANVDLAIPPLFGKTEVMLHSEKGLLCDTTR